MITRYQIPDTTHVLELTDQEIDIIHDAMIAYVFTDSKFARPEIRDVLSAVQAARGRANIRKAQQEHSRESLSRHPPSYPLLDQLTVCQPATADPVKPQGRLRAKARPQGVTGSAPAGNRAAIPRKAKSK